MTNIADEGKEIDKVMDFICEVKEGKYTLEIPDLTQISYARMEIQEGNATNIFNDYCDEAILYGVSY